jgi:hypothetical protein
MTISRFPLVGVLRGGRKSNASSIELAAVRGQLAAVGLELEAERRRNLPLEDAALRSQLAAVGLELEVERRRNLALEALLDAGPTPAIVQNALPSVLFNALPKSASTYCFEVLRRAGGYHESMISVGIFPGDVMSWRRYFAFTAGGHIAHHHLDASPVNLWLLRHRPVRLVLHLRDPRQTIVAWLHHLVRAGVREVPPLTAASPPSEWFDQDEAAQLDWLIENHLPIFVGWIEKWVRAADAGGIALLFTTFEMMVQDPEAFFEKLAAYCGLEKPSINIPDPQGDPLFQFRAGRVDEWRERLTAVQQQRVGEAVPADLLRRFGWA